jgi:hypothetical protein
MGGLRNDMGAYGGPGSSVIIVGIEEIPSSAEGVAGDFQLYQNYPNPFNPSTTIRYTLPKSEFVTLKVYDILGRKVATLVNERQTAGEKSLLWNGRDRLGKELSSGIYIYQIQASDFIKSRKMVLLR